MSNTRPSESRSRLIADGTDGTTIQWTDLWAEAGWLRELARQLGCEANAAEDAVQETLLSARGVLALESSSRSARGWLRVALRHRIGMGRRAEARRRVRERLAAKPEADDNDPHKALERQELGARLTAAVAELPQRDREIIALRHAAGMSPAAIAASLGTTANAVSCRLTRIHRLIREQLERDELSPFGGRLAAPLAFLSALAMKKTIALSALGLLVAALATAWVVNSERLPRQSAPTLPTTEVAELVDIEPVTLQLDDVAMVEETPSETRSGVQTPPMAATEPAAAPPIPEVTTGSVLVTVTEHGTGRPAANVGVASLFQTNANGWSKQGHERLGLTNSIGQALLEDLPPGDITVYVNSPDASGTYESERTHVVAREIAQVKFTVDESQRAFGRVVDESGSPVVGARIWRGQAAGPSSPYGDFVAVSKHDGSFVVPYSGSIQPVSAFKPGYAPSATSAMVGVPSGGHDGHAAGLELVLSGRRGKVFGQVLNPTGSPVVGARVVISQPWESINDPSTGDWTGCWTAAPQSRDSDHVGSFEFKDVGVGDYSLEVRVAGGALATLEVSVTDGGNHELAVRLETGGTLRGAVRNQDGVAVAGARISVTPNGRTSMSGITVATDQAGAFKLTGLGPGEVELQLEGPNSVTRTVETLMFSNGQVTRWDPTMGPPPQILGRVRSSDGSPLVGWRISVPGRNARTDENGDFALAPGPGDLFRLRVHPAGVLMGGHVLERHDVAPGGDPIEFTVPAELVPTGTLTGRFVDADGAPLSGDVTFQVQGTGLLILRATAGADGRFELRYVPETSGILQLKSEDRDPLEVELEQGVEPNETRDLGDLTLGPRR